MKTHRAQTMQNFISSHQRIFSRWPAMLVALLLGAAASVTASAAEPKGMLETIHHHKILTSTIPENGDVNPYAVVVAPVSIGAIEKDDVLVDNFNNISNLQGTGTTIIRYR